MNTRYLLSGSLAFGLHVGVLFGVRTAPAAPRVPVSAPNPAPATLVIQPPDEEPLELERSDVQSADRASRSRDIGEPDLESLTTEITPGVLVPALSAVDTAYRVPIGSPPASWGPGPADGPGDGWGKTYAPGAVDELPRAVYRALPTFPADMRREGITGEVKLSFVVGRDGAVREAEVVSSTARSFEEPALRAIRAWRFKPGIKGGAPVATRMMMPMLFVLTES